ncbi:hypothetical protein AAULH_07381 [Lactobacillus helveticus MTCC 5463]|nr:hypothetical protein AAULH_07381 [Lactobacillus helveticus MTCC 5463]
MGEKTKKKNKDEESIGHFFLRHNHYVCDFDGDLLFCI